MLIQNQQTGVLSTEEFCLLRDENCSGLMNLNLSTCLTGHTFIKNNDEQLIPVRNISEHENLIRDYIILSSLFNKELEDHPEKFSEFSRTRIKDSFNEVLTSILRYKHSQLVFNITEDESVFFSFTSNNRSVFLELFFDVELETQSELITNIYFENELELASGGQIAEIFLRIEHLFEIKTKTIPNQTNSPYGISKKVTAFQTF